MAVLQRKLAELGRIRIGDTVPVKGREGVTRPRRLETFRLTSVNKPRLEYAAQLWGGKVERWEESPQERCWQLYTAEASLPVVVPPFNALSQYNEIWQGGECRLRCDGDCIVFSTRTDAIGTECFCAGMPLQERLQKAKEGKACQTVTRLSLILPDLPGVGVWRLDTNSYYAGMELQGATELLQDASAEGVYIECTLQVEQRRVVRRSAEGKTQTQVFPVITLQPNVSMRQLISRNIPADALVAGPPPPKQLPQMIDDLYGEDPRQVTHNGQHDPSPISEESLESEVLDERTATEPALFQPVPDDRREEMSHAAPAPEEPADVPAWLTSGLRAVAQADAVLQQYAADPRADGLRSLVGRFRSRTEARTSKPAGYDNLVDQIQQATKHVQELEPAQPQEEGA